MAAQGNGSDLGDLTPYPQDQSQSVFWQDLFAAMEDESRPPGGTRGPGGRRSERNRRESLPAQAASASHSAINASPSLQDLSGLFGQPPTNPPLDSAELFARALQVLGASQPPIPNAPLHPNFGETSQAPPNAFLFPWLQQPPQATTSQSHALPFPYGTNQGFPATSSSGSAPTTPPLEGPSTARGVTAEPELTEADSAAVTEDKRRRNTAASARFRIKKKQKVLNLERTVSDLTGRAEDLEREATELRRENGWLKEIIMLKSRSVAGGSVPEPESHATESLESLEIDGTGESSTGANSEGRRGRGKKKA